MPVYLKNVLFLCLAGVLAVSCSRHVEEKSAPKVQEPSAPPSDPPRGSTVTYQMPEPGPVPPPRTFPETEADGLGDPGRLNVSVPGEGIMSLAVYDKAGRMVRELMRGTPVVPGPLELTWDGLDFQGFPATDGEYQWRMVFNPGFQSRYVMNFGTQHTDKPWEYWIADHGGPGAAALDPEGNVFIGGFTEGPYLWLKMDPQVQKRLHSQEQYYDGGMCTDLTHAGDAMLLLQSGFKRAHIRRLTDGALWDVFWPAPGAAPESGEPACMDGAGSTLVLSYPARNALRWVNPADGKVIAETTGLPGAKAVAVGRNAQGTFVLVSTSDGRVVRLKDAASKPEKVLDLDGVTSMNINRTDGRIVLTRENGKVAEVRLYSPDFKWLRTFGGIVRPDGLFDARLYRSLTTALFLADGRILVLENSPPRRVMILDPATDRQELAGYGNRTFYTWAKVDPRRPDFHWVTMEGSVMLMRVNPAGGLWEPVAVWNYRDLLDGLLFAQSATHWGQPWQPHYLKDRLYLLGAGLPAAVEVDAKNWKLIPRSFLGTAPKEMKDWPEALKSALHSAGTDTAGWSKHFTWADANGNGLMEAPEIQIQQGSWNPASSPGAYGTRLDFVHGLSLGNKWLQIPFHAWVGPQEGYPRWTWQGARELGELPESIRGQDARNAHVDAEDNVFAAFYHEIQVHDQLVARWPHGGFWGARLASWDKDGRLRFLAGRKCNADGEAGQGRLSFPTFVMSGPYDTVMVNDQIHNHGPLYTRDGLFVGNMFVPGVKNHVDEKTPAEAYAMKGPRDDNQNAYAWTMPDGKTYFAEGDIGRQRVFEVTGLDQVRRVRGKMSKPAVVTAAQRKGTGLTLKLYADRDKTELVETRAIPNLRSGTLFHTLPHPRLKKPYTAELTGFLEAPFSEEYTFEFRSSQPQDKINVWIGDRELYQATQGQPTKATVRLEAGKKVPFRMDFRVLSNQPGFDILWQSLNQDLWPVEAMYLYPEK
ncbi:MAG: PA14 domain-containing protein [Verrucomicrobiae bacterium]|nr:PA14 domain-containing protein [Verrucomicrobiae bacterium]